VLKSYIETWLLWLAIMPLTFVLRFYFYAHVLRLGKKSHTGLSRTANVFVFNGIPGVSTKASSKKVIATTIGAILLLAYSHLSVGGCN